MKKLILIVTTFIFISIYSFAQGGWSLCNGPVFNDRVDDVFMVGTQIGYAVGGEGIIVKTTDGGNNWASINLDTSVYCRSVEFINTQKGFVGAFPKTVATTNILRKTTNGGASWTDVSPLLDVRARKGICGLSIPDSNTIYGCGNFYQDSAYIVKSIDGGNTWSFIDMHIYASHLIDMYFISKDTGFATGSGPLPGLSAIILYTTDGGQTWALKYQNTVSSEYCWKIQHLTNSIYFASIQGPLNGVSQVVKSTDGGMTWNAQTVTTAPNLVSGIQGIGFINPMKGWTGGGGGSSFESNDGGITWDTTHICPFMNRVFKVNDSLLFATGNDIWKYSITATGIAHSTSEVPQFASLYCYPNPASKILNVDLTLHQSTRAYLILLDEQGKRIKIIDNANKAKGTYKYMLDTDMLKDGFYYIVLKTYEDDKTVKVIVKH